MYVSKIAKTVCARGGGGCGRESQNYKYQPNAISFVPKESLVIVRQNVHNDRRYAKVKIHRHSREK